MRRFSLAVCAYVAACLIAAGFIVLRGDGSHPRVLSVYPFNGDRYFPGGAAEIAFSQPMDESSVERGLEVTPGSQGQGIWYGNILNLQPVGDWRPDVTYHVRLLGSVADDQGRPLPTPFSFWFRVHHVSRVGFCTVRRVRNVCERLSHSWRPLTEVPQPVLRYALSPDGSLLAYTRRDASGLRHLFVVQVDGSGARQLTHGARYADVAVAWPPNDSSSIDYWRRPVIRIGGRRALGPRQLWNVNVDGSGNARIGT